MKIGVVRGCCVALAIAALLVPTAVVAQEHRGSRAFGGSTRHDGGRSYGGRSWGGHDNDYGRHERHSTTSFSFGLGLGWDPWWWGPWGYPDPYYRPYGYSYPYYSYPYYVPPVVVAPPVVTQPPVYEEQMPVQQEQGESVWYYCPDPAGYYPYVRRCPKGWQKVAPTPESAQPPEVAPAEPQAPPTPEAGDPVPYEYRWYYCQDPPGYYPYVQDCPKGWTTVAPTPAPAR